MSTSTPVCRFITLHFSDALGASQGSSVSFTKDDSMPKRSYNPGDIIRGHVEFEISPGSSVHSLTRLSLPHVFRHTSHHHASEPGDDLVDSNGHDASSTCGEGNESIAEIHLRLDGYGKTQWRASNENGGKVQMHEKFVCIQGTLNVTQKLGHGIHQLPFEFELPDDVPPSFEGKYGFIRYRICAKVGHSHHDTKFPFTVVYAEKVNRDDPLMEAGEDARQRDLSVLCVSKGSRKVHAKVDRTVYCYHGDVALISARLSNECNVAASPAVKLIEQQTYFARGLISKTFKKHNKTWLLSPAADISPLQPGEERCWNNVECTLPGVPPSFHSPLIDINYYIEIELADEKLSRTSKAAAKMLMSSSPKHNAIASIWVLMADGQFQKIPGVHLAHPSKMSMDSKNSNASLISDDGTAMVPTAHIEMFTADDGIVTVFKSQTEKQGKAGGDKKASMPSIGEEMKGNC